MKYRKLPVIKHNSTDLTELKIGHSSVFKSIKKALEHVENDLRKQKLKFNKTKESKNYTFERKQTGLSTWSKKVIKRFNGHCCVCFTTEKLHAHHLYSYKYYPDLRIDINNGVCLCVECHTIFHDFFGSVCSAAHFFDFRNIMNNERLRGYIEEALILHNPIDVTQQLTNKNIEFEVIQTLYLRFIIHKPRTSFSRSRNPDQYFVKIGLTFPDFPKKLSEINL